MSEPSEMATKPKKPWAIILFALPFAGIGIGFFFFSIIPTLYQGISMNAWHETTATVISAELKSYQGDSTTYEAQGLYHYGVEGQHYAGTRLGISSGADNIGNWHQRMSGKLSSARSKQSPINIYFNPDNPSQAIVDRSPRWSLLGFKMIFVLVFGGVGTGLIYWAMRDHNKFIDTPAAIDRPWLAHRDWASATIDSNARGTLYLTWIMTLLWNAISSPLLFAIPRELGRGNHTILIAALFPAVGLGLLLWAIRATRRWRAIGATPLTLDPYPGSIGGQVGGSINTNLPYDSNNAFPVTLYCLHSYLSGSGKNRSRRESVKWSAEGFARSEPRGRGSRITFGFDVPGGLPESELKARSYHLWRLTLKSEGTTINLDRNFEIPVFDTAEISRDIRVDSASHPLAEERRYDRIDAVMVMRQSADGIELEFPAGRNPGLNGGIAAVGLFFFGSGMLAGYLGAPLALTIIFGLVGGAIALGGLYSLLNSLHVRISEQSVQTRRTLLGMIISKSQAASSEVRQLRIHKTGSMTSGSKHTVFFAIRAHLGSGKKLTLAESLVGPGAAQQVAEALASYGGFELNTTVVTASQLRAERNKRNKRSNRS